LAPRCRHARSGATVPAALFSPWPTARPDWPARPPLTRTGCGRYWPRSPRATDTTRQRAVHRP